MKSNVKKYRAPANDFPSKFPPALGRQVFANCKHGETETKTNWQQGRGEGGADWLSTIVYKGNELVTNYTESGLALFGDFKRNLNIHCAKLTD